MKNRKTDAFLPLIIALVLMAGMLIGLKLRDAPVVNIGNWMLSFDKPTNKVNHVLRLVTGSYVDSVSANSLEEDAIKGMLKNLDPHSQYIPASEFSAVNDPLEGNFSGIGVFFNMLNDTIVVVNTVDKGPSDKAGIAAGDRIIRVNDSLVAGVKMPSDDIVKMMKGKTGTDVKVTTYRKGTGNLLDFTVTRGKVPLFSIDAAYMLTPETGYVKVSRFAKTTLQEFTEAVSRLEKEGMKKLMIDLRDNGGGLIDVATGMSELFLPAGTLIVYTEGSERPRTNYYANSRNARYADMELAVLINESSASASEIVAGAIQDNDRGTIIGRRSFGKGLVQEQYPFPDGSALRLTVARYYTPTGRCIQKPYGDKNNYYNELNERYANGEMTQKDSIHFNDSLRFITPAGRVVYGGGGIMPDVFVPVDTSSYSKYYGLVLRKGLTYRFAFEYADRHRKELTRYTGHKALEEFLQQKNLLTEFTAYAARQGVAPNDKEIHTSGSILENLIIASVARNILDDKGFYPILNQKDNIIQKGIEVLQ